MPKLTYRNSQGRLVDIATVAATEAKNEFGTILDRITQGGVVAITRHEKPKAVLLSFDEFTALTKAGSRTLDGLTREFDALLVRMQTPRSRKGVETAFASSPQALGRAALKAARATRPPVLKRSRRTGPSAS